MPPRTALKLVPPWLLTVLMALVPQPQARAAAQAQPAASADEKAIRELEQAFVRDYNQGDSKALAGRFTEDAEVVEVEGDRDVGRGEIEQRFVETFAASPGVKLVLDIESIRFVHPEVAQEVGRALVTPAKGPPVARHYTVIHVKRNGQWLISSIREESDPQARPHDRLKDLEWMIGDWIDEGSDAVVRLNCRWSPDENFLLRDFTVKFQGRSLMAVSQRIGWDPVTRRIRSWEFDSEGGFGEGTWSRDGDQWVVKYTGTRPEGATASATNTLTMVRPDLVRWVSTERVLGADFLGGEVSYVLVRVPPAPRLSSPAVAPSKPQATRRP
jgi:uncharacterized protein (TIGR02246 family)